MKRKNKIEIYTDGACQDGIGGWSYVIIKNNKFEIKNSGFALNTTNNQMELLAIDKALKAVSENNNIVVYTDSQYVIDAILVQSPIWEKIGRASCRERV